MTAIIEGMEEDICVLEIDGIHRDIPRTQVSPEAKPGDVVVWDGHSWNPDHTLTAERSAKIRRLMDQVWED